VAASAPPRRVAILVAAALLALACGLPATVTAHGPLAPLDRAIVAVPPIYPAPSGGFLRLPETRSTPVRSGEVRSGEDPNLRHAPALPGPPGDRPIWRPSRLEPAVGIDARGRVTSTLEYTPGRFER
jgi:hypothetical protein